jgi:hypothetical protein
MLLAEGKMKQLVGMFCSMLSLVVGAAAQPTSSTIDLARQLYAAQSNNVPASESPWITETLSDSPFTYNLNSGEALTFDSFTVFPARNKNTAQVVLLALFGSRIIIAMEPDLGSKKLMLTNVGSGAAVAFRPFDASGTYALSQDEAVNQSLLGDTLTKALCVWNTAKSSLAISSVGDLPRFICNFNSLGADVHSMISMAKSVGGCVTGSIGLCVVAAAEIGLLVADPACRPSWMTSCFFSGGSSVDPDQQARQDMNNRAARDSRFGSPQNGTFGSNLNWSPDWELRWMNFAFSARYSSTIVTMFHARSKQNASIRYVGFWDPDANTWRGWDQAQ